MNKFGMFIHWGLYAMTGEHEQALAKLDIPFNEYANFNCIETYKNGKTYLHLCDGAKSSALIFLVAPYLVRPKRARLLNNGQELRIRFGNLPDFAVRNTGVSGGPFLSIADLPVDDFENEVMIVELEW